MMHKNLSVLIPNYNHAHYISEALDAILTQSYPPFEIIIIDDDSTDNSFKILEGYAQKYSSIKVYRNDHNMGVNFNMTRLLELAKGDYVYSAAADDKILPGFFEKSMNLLSHHPEAGLSSTLSLCIDENGKSHGVYYTPVVSNKECFIPPNKTLPLLQKHGSWIQGNTTIYKRSALIDSGGYIPELHAFSDGFIHMVIAAKYGVCYIPEPLAAWRILETSYSATSIKDKEQSQDIILNSTALMRNKYSELFPQEFVDQWEKSALLSNELLRLFDIQNASFENLKKMLPSQNIMDKFLFRIRRIITKIEYIFLKYYLYRRAGLPVNQLSFQRIRQTWRRISSY
jgi:glycosyltransferase involved in cell wall biosynthesis